MPLHNRKEVRGSGYLSYNHRDIATVEDFTNLRSNITKDSEMKNKVAVRHPEFCFLAVFSFKKKKKNLK